MDTQRAEGQSCDELFVIVVDENPFHARATESTLAKSNFQTMVYTSPIKALNFLKDHEQDVDFVLVAVHMEEMHGFQFLESSREMHKNLQVIMMASEATWPIMQRCVDLGARFLVKKPVDTSAVRNIWQYLDRKQLRMENIKTLFKGIQGTTYGVNCSSQEGLENDLNTCEEGTSKKSAHLMWTPFLQKKFLHAVELLGDAATPKKIELLMNVNSIDRKQISAHLQKHRKRMDKELKDSMLLKKAGKNSSSSRRLRKSCEEAVSENNDIQPEDRTVTENIIRETKGRKVYEAMRKALQHGTVFDEQLSDDPSAEEAEQGEAYMMEDSTAQDNAAGAKEVSNNADSDEGGPVKLVTYSDSEDA